MFKKKSRNTSEQVSQQPNELVCKNYQKPLPQYPPRPTELEILVYVAGTINQKNQKQNNNFNHSESSPFRVVAPGKK